MKEDDIEEILEIESQSFTTPWTRNAFLIELRENLLAQYIVAQVDNKVIAYAGIWKILNEGHITNIAVLREYRGMGVGNFLMDGLICHCMKNSIDRMTLEVRESNTIARNLYRKYGFIDSGIRPEYYGDNKEDAIIMWRENRRGD